MSFIDQLQYGVFQGLAIFFIMVMLMMPVTILVGTVLPKGSLKRWWTFLEATPLVHRKILEIGQSTVASLALKKLACHDVLSHTPSYGYSLLYMLVFSQRRDKILGLQEAGDTWLGISVSFDMVDK